MNNLFLNKIQTQAFKNHTTSFWLTSRWGAPNTIDYQRFFGQRQLPDVVKTDFLRSFCLFLLQPFWLYDIKALCIFFLNATTWNQRLSSRQNLAVRITANATPRSSFLAIYEKTIHSRRTFTRKCQYGKHTPELHRSKKKWININL